MKQMTEEEFDKKFTIQKNHLTGNESFGGMYETYGEEIQYVKDLDKKEKRVWTIIEGDSPREECEYEAREEECPDADGGCAESHDHYVKCHISPMYYVSGFHWVNRLGFIVTNEPYKEDTEVELED